MLQFITAGLVGSLLTFIFQAIINELSDRVKYRRDLRKQIFTRKLEVVENATTWYQEALDNYYILQTSLREYDKDSNPAAILKLATACEKSSTLFEQTSTRLNALYLYYDFSDIEKKYHSRESMECMNQSVTIIAKINNELSSITPSEFAQQRISELLEQREIAAHKLANAIDNQVFTIVEISQRLRNEYRGYLD